MTRRAGSPPAELSVRVLREGAPKMVLLSFVPTKHPLLTEAERATALGVCRGLSNAEIAAERSVSVRTVANQVASILKKLDVWSRAEVAARLSIADLL